MKWRDAVQRGNSNNGSRQKSLDLWTLVILHWGFLGVLVLINLKIFPITLLLQRVEYSNIVLDSEFRLQPFLYSRIHKSSN